MPPPALARIRSVTRSQYLASGVGLFALKFAIDYAVLTWAFGRPWSPWSYLIWPDSATLRVHDLPPADQAVALTLLAVSLPFITAGILLTVGRLRDARLPKALVAFFFLPVINFLLFTVLLLVPSRPAEVEAAEPLSEPFAEMRRRHRVIVGERRIAAGALAVLASVPAVVVLVYFGAQYLESYGFGLFVGAPFVLGMSSVLLFGVARPQRLGACLLVGFSAATLAGLVVLAIALEGAICLIMAAPIAYALAFLGSMVGYAIQARPWASHSSPYYMLALMVALPGLMAAEAAHEPEPVLREVRTEVIVDATRSAVWKHVVAFPPLAEPDDWLFRAGVAYPLRAEIAGRGPGAVRHCVFSTGTFVEPIETWDEPHLLRFAVTESPCPMHELSWTDIHPPHLHHYLVSRRGQFLLEELPDGRTRLEGTTWYTNRMWPAPYWGLWSDAIIHKIHRRVLEHIRTLAEEKGGPRIRTDGRHG